MDTSTKRLVVVAALVAVWSGYVLFSEERAKVTDRYSADWALFGVAPGMTAVRLAEETAGLRREQVAMRPGDSSVYSSVTAPRPDSLFNYYTYETGSEGVVCSVTAHRIFSLAMSGEKRRALQQQIMAQLVTSYGRYKTEIVEDGSERWMWQEQDSGAHLPLGMVSAVLSPVSADASKMALQVFLDEAGCSQPLTTAHRD